MFIKIVTLFISAVSFALGLQFAAAQQPIGLTVTLCSKLNPAAKPVMGTLIDNPDSATYRLYTDLGELTIRRADFAVCPPPSAQGGPGKPNTPVEPVKAKQACPEGQIEGQGGCACPVTQVMKDGRCVAPDHPTAHARKCEKFEDVAAQGSGTVGLGVMPYLIQGFANANGYALTRSDDERNKTRVFQLQNAANPGAACLRVSVRSSGSNEALEGMIDRTAQIGMSSRAFEDAEIEHLPPPPGGGPVARSAVERVVALDAVVVVVNKNNPTRSLSLCDLAKIYSGKIRNWNEAGGKSGAIKAHIRSGTSGTYETFESLVMKNCGEELARGVPIPHGNYAKVLEAVAADEGAIAFAPLALTNSTISALPIRGECGLEQTATPFHVKTEDYLLARRLFIFTPIQLEDQARSLITFIKADDRADDALSMALPPDAATPNGAENLHAVDQRIISQRDEHANAANARETREDANSLSQFRTRTQNAQRLSISYRFRFNSAELDTKARQDVQRLARYLQKNPAQGTLILAGFGDNVGSVPAGLTLSTSRAQAVYEELKALGADRFVREIRVTGYGKILPVACNGTGLGQEKNRRVEVYIAP